MPFNISQLEAILRAPGLSQVVGGAVAIVLALITALGGAGSSDSPADTNNTGGSSLTGPATPGPILGEGVPLATLVDSGDAVKGSVRVGGKTYQNSWTFGSNDWQYFELKGEYRVLKATVGYIDGQVPPSNPAKLTINGKSFTVDKNNPIREVEVDITDVDRLKIYSSYTDGRKLGLGNPIVYKAR